MAPQTFIKEITLRNSAISDMIRGQYRNESTGERYPESDVDVEFIASVNGEEEFVVTLHGQPCKYLHVTIKVEEISTNAANEGTTCLDPKMGDEIFSEEIGQVIVASECTLAVVRVAMGDGHVFVYRKRS